MSELFLEGRQKSGSENDITIKASLDAGGAHVEDIVKITVVDIALGSGAYREMAMLGLSDRGHSGLLWKYTGNCSRGSLQDQANIGIMEAQSSPDGIVATNLKSGFTSHPDDLDYWGIYNTSVGNYTNRIKILRVADGLWARRAEIDEGRIEYQWNDCITALEGEGWSPWGDNSNDWSGEIIQINSMRCDAIIEYAYEKSDINVWAMHRLHLPQTDSYNYLVNATEDFWEYNEITGDWDYESNDQNDNLEEHNDFDTFGFADTLMPSTQCGFVTPQQGKANTCMTKCTQYEYGINP